MNVNSMTELLLGVLEIRRGRVATIDAEGAIQVEDDSGELSVPCDFLRSSADAAVALRAGDPVLYAVDEERTRGCVLGVIEKYGASVRGGAGDAGQAQPAQRRRRLTLSADEKIEIRCGESLLAMDSEGKILIRGTQVTSRASETQRIKGGTVKIN